MTQPSHLGTEQPTLGPESGLRVQDSARGLGTGWKRECRCLWTRAEQAEMNKGFLAAVPLAHTGFGETEFTP